jgi:hypothetical protein
VSQWSRLDSRELPKSFSELLEEPSRLLRGLPRRWPGPLDAATHYGMPPDAFHLPYQCALLLTRAAQFCGRVARSHVRA